MSLATMIKQVYKQTIGGTAPSGAASSTGDISQMVKYLVANPPGSTKAPIFIGPLSSVAMGGSHTDGLTTTNTASVLTANLAYAYPFLISESVTVKKMWYVCAAASGNIDIGIYNEAFAKVVANGSTVCATGTSSGVTDVDIADTVLAPGRYYAAFVVGNATATFQLVTPKGTSWTAVATPFQSAGAFRQAAAFPLPATLTPAVHNDSQLPYFGLSLRTLTG